MLIFLRTDDVGRMSVEVNNHLDDFKEKKLRVTTTTINSKSTEKSSSL